jgi:hypothetical protein
MNVLDPVMGLGLGMSLGMGATMSGRAAGVSDAGFGLGVPGAVVSPSKTPYGDVDVASLDGAHELLMSPFTALTPPPGTSSTAPLNAEVTADDLAAMDALDDFLMSSAAPDVDLMW